MSQKDPRYDIHDLSAKFLKGTLTEAEREWLERWYAGFDDSLLEIEESRHNSREALRDSMKRGIYAATGLSRRGPRRLWLLALSAAAVACVAAFTVFFSSRNPPPVARTAVIQPGSDKAVLTLANGKTIVLDEASMGNLATEQGVGIAKTGQSTVSYQSRQGGQAAVATPVYNTIRTPRGGQFRLTLADGTRIWLNSDSYVRFPVSFTGKERRIEAGGELYLEVAKDRSKKFLVQTERQTIQVLGTRFNINAYPDEPETRTTLFEGSVQLSSGQSTLLLKPGQQSVLSPRKGLQIDENADPEVAEAWKNGYFMFDREDIKSAMRKIGRWYDVEVVYEGAIPDDWIGGSISRYKRVEDVLAKLELTGQFKFKIAGRRVIVMH